MITLEQFLKAAEFKITEGSRYTWDCFGHDAYSLDSWDREKDYTFSITFDTVTQEVYQVQAYDYKRNRAYRMTNPAYKKAHNDECLRRGVVDCAWEDDSGSPIDYVILSLMKIAHSKDITFNQLVAEVIQQVIDQETA